MAFMPGTKCFKQSKKDELIEQTQMESFKEALYKVEKERVVKNEYTYICPHCKKEMYYVGQDQRCTVHYEYTFDYGQWDINEHDDCEYIEFYCPNCSGALPAELEKEILKQINKGRKVK